MTMLTTLVPSTPSRPARWSGAERRSVAGMAGAVLLLNVVGWGILLLAAATW
ncbi:hypothetical protein [Georgenia yuyongxinii]